MAICWKNKYRIFWAGGRKNGNLSGVSVLNISNLRVRKSCHIFIIRSLPISTRKRSLPRSILILDESFYRGRDRPRILSRVSPLSRGSEDGHNSGIFERG